MDDSRIALLAPALRPACAGEHGGNLHGHRATPERGIETSKEHE
jgi:hypothetical protein